MNLTGLEQFHQGKSDDETHRSPLEASQSQVHRAEGSADDRLAQGPGDEIALSAVAVPSVSGIGLTVMQRASRAATAPSHSRSPGEAGMQVG